MRLLLKQRTTNAGSDGVVALLITDVLGATAQAPWGQAAAIVIGRLRRTRHAGQGGLNREDACWVGGGLGACNGDQGGGLERAGGATALDQDDQDGQQQTNDHSVN